MAVHGAPRLTIFDLHPPAYESYTRTSVSYPLHTMPGPFERALRVRAAHSPRKCGMHASTTTHMLEVFSLTMPYHLPLRSNARKPTNKQDRWRNLHTAAVAVAKKFDQTGGRAWRPVLILSTT